MSCPPEIARILLQILRVGSLRIRAAGWAGDAARCAVEADHVHNLPEVLENFSVEGLRYYWEVERLSFERRLGAADREGFASHWEQLRLVMEVEETVVASEGA